jgi:hypothetical protein
MTSMRGSAGKSGAVTLALALTVLALLLGLGISGAVHVSNLRHTLEWVHARQLAECAAASAFEEVSARLTERFGTVPLAKKGDPPLPDRMAVEWPEKVDPTICKADLKAEGIEVSTVGISSVTPWELIRDGKLVQTLLQFLGVAIDPALKLHLIQEAGIVELTTTVKVNLGNTRMTRKITVRRYVTVSAIEGKEGLPKRGKVVILSGNLVKEISEV